MDNLTKDQVKTILSIIRNDYQIVTTLRLIKGFLGISLIEAKDVYNNYK
jgi:hypothetical protein